MYETIMSGLWSVKTHIPTVHFFIGNLFRHRHGRTYVIERLVVFFPLCLRPVVKELQENARLNLRTTSVWSSIKL